MFDRVFAGLIPIMVILLVGCDSGRENESDALDRKFAAMDASLDRSEKMLAKLSEANEIKRKELEVKKRIIAIEKLALEVKSIELNANGLSSDEKFERIERIGRELEKLRD